MSSRFIISNIERFTFLFNFYRLKPKNERNFFFTSVSAGYDVGKVRSRKTMELKRHIVMYQMSSGFAFIQRTVIEICYNRQ